MSFDTSNFGPAEAPAPSLHERMADLLWKRYQDAGARWAEGADRPGDYERYVLMVVAFGTLAQFLARTGLGE